MRDCVAELFRERTSIVDYPEPDFLIFLAKVICVGKIDVAKCLSNSLLPHGARLLTNISEDIVGLLCRERCEST
jgi:hypothetical protein